MSRNGATRDLFEPSRGRFGDADDRFTPVKCSLTYISESQTGKAMICCEIGLSSGPTIVIPRSQVTKLEPENPTNGQTIEFRIPKWLAREKGLI